MKKRTRNTNPEQKTENAANKNQQHNYEMGELKETSKYKMEAHGTGQPQKSKQRPE
jgi:hypothetical protein